MNDWNANLPSSGASQQPCAVALSPTDPPIAAPAARACAGQSLTYMVRTKRATLATMKSGTRNGNHRRNGRNTGGGGGGGRLRCWCPGPWRPWCPGPWLRWRSLLGRSWPPRSPLAASMGTTAVSPRRGMARAAAGARARGLLDPGWRRAECERAGRDSAAREGRLARVASWWRWCGGGEEDETRWRPGKERTQKENDLYF